MSRNVRFPRKRGRLLPRILLVCAFFLTVWLFYMLIGFFMGDKETEMIPNDVPINVQDSPASGQQQAGGLGASFPDSSLQGTSSPNISSPNTSSLDTSFSGDSKPASPRPRASGTPQNNAAIAAQAKQQYRAKISTLPPGTLMSGNTGSPLDEKVNTAPQEAMLHNARASDNTALQTEPTQAQVASTSPTTPRQAPSLPAESSPPPSLAPSLTATAATSSSAPSSASLKKLHNGVSWNIPYVGVKLNDIATAIQQKHPQMRSGKLEFQPFGLAYTSLAGQAGLPPKSIALTINGCGPFGADDSLFALLEKENIPTTFFLSSAWIVKHKKDFTTIEKNHLFSIQGHGKKHIPLSLQGENAHGIKGADSLLAILQETEGNARDIQRLTNKRPSWFRGAFNVYDKEAITVVSRELNLPIAGYSLDATGPTPVVMANKLINAKAGDIVMVQFASGQQLSDALSEAIPRLKSQGFIFVPLPDPSTVR